MNMAKKLPLIFHDDYDSADIAADHRFPMRKYSALADYARDRQWLRPENTFAPEPIGWADIARVHASDYVEGLREDTLDPQIIRRIGFPIRPSIVMRARLASAGTLLGARFALSGGIAINMAGGSHHADRAGGAGFCVLNDVAIAASVLLAQKTIRQCLVIDLDVHQGDGTARIFADDDRVFTFSMHCQQNFPREKAMSDFDMALERGTSDSDYLASLCRVLPGLLATSRPDLVFFNAGVDIHEDDRLGLLNVSENGIRQRERLVFGACLQARIPIVGVLGGGYQNDVQTLARLHAIQIEVAQELLQRAT